MALAVLLSLLYACLIFVPRLVSGFFGTAGGSTDAASHYLWAKDYLSALSQGVVLPSWAASMYAGLGSPILLIFPPLFYFAASALTFVIGDLYLAIIAVLAAANILSGVVAFQMFRRLDLSLLGLLAAALIQLSPLAQVTDTAFAAWPTYIAIPFALLYLHCSIHIEPGRFLHIPVALAAGALCLAHILTAFNAFLCTGIAAAAIATIGARHGGLRRDSPAAPIHTLAGWGFSTLLGIALAAFYVLPALSSVPLFAPESVTSSFPWYKAFLLSPLTGARYGLYWPLVQIVLPGVSIVFLLAGWWSTWRANALRQEPARFRRALRILLWVASISTFLATELSYPLWQHVQAIRMNLLPARLLQLAFVTSVLAFLLGWWSFTRHAPRARRVGLAIGVAVPAALATALALQFYAFDGKPREFLASPLATEKRDHAGYYLPKHAAPGWMSYVAAGALHGACREKNLTCRIIANGAERKAWEVTARQRVTLELPLFWFPNWVVTLDGVPQAPAPAAASGVIAVAIPPGTHRVEATWERGREATAGLAISALAASVCLGAFLLQRRRAPQQLASPPVR
ncbi:MAG: hypothetical protein IT531_02290 [Burkholderiales bacterium]|nr:hypothetical protein [Burkholderiales bacterium]